MDSGYAIGKKSRTSGLYGEVVPPVKGVWRHGGREKGMMFSMEKSGEESTDRSGQLLFH
jgi:hypothetical protein